MKIDVFYTGSGIWLSEGILEDGTCAIVSNDSHEFLSIYNGEDYLPEDMIFSKHYKDLDPYHEEIYNRLLHHLSKTSPLD